jgi:hypothetical protein
MSGRTNIMSLPRHYSTVCSLILSQNGSSALHHAVFGGHLQACQYLMSLEGTNINTVDQVCEVSLPLYSELSRYLDILAAVHVLI